MIGVAVYGCALSIKGGDKNNKGNVIVCEKDRNLSSQITLPNTTYVICYDFDINKEVLTIPEGCLLKFKGGRIKNGQILFNKTRIESKDAGIFYNINAKIIGLPVQKEARIDWFTNSDNNDYVNWANALRIADTLCLKANKTYHFSENTLGYSLLKRDICIKGNNATIVLDPNYQLKGSNYCALTYSKPNG